MFWKNRGIRTCFCLVNIFERQTRVLEKPKIHVFSLNAMFGL